MDTGDMAVDMERTLLILGAGSLCQVVAEMAQMSGRYTKIAFLDDRPTPEKERQYAIVGRTDEIAAFRGKYAYAIPAIGCNEARLSLMKRLKTLGFAVPCMVHPSAFVSPLAEIGDGSIVRAKAAIARQTCVGEACLINLGALIDHGCVIGEGSHIPMGCVVRNEVRLPPMSSFRPNEVVQ